MDGVHLQSDLDGVRGSEATLVGRLSVGFDPDADSLLPGWSVGHVLTHIARNADSVAGMIEGALAGRVADQYPGGFEGRAAEIDAGAGRDRDALVEDVHTSGDRVLRLAADVDAPTWANGRGRVVSGDEFPLWRILVSRWREVEIHHVDLGLGYRPVDWPADFVARSLPIRLAEVNARRAPDEQFTIPAITTAGTGTELDGPAYEVLAYLFGRGSLPGHPDLAF